MENLKERLDNLEMFLHELAERRFHYLSEVESQANYHLATMDLLKSRGGYAVYFDDECTYTQNYLVSCNKESLAYRSLEEATVTMDSWRAKGENPKLEVVLVLKAEGK